MKIKELISCLNESSREEISKSVYDEIKGSVRNEVKDHLLRINNDII